MGGGGGGGGGGSDGCSGGTAAASKAPEEGWVSRGKKSRRGVETRGQAFQDVPLGGGRGDRSDRGDGTAAATVAVAVAAAAARRKAPEEGWVRRDTSKEKRTWHKRISSPQGAGHTQAWRQLPISGIDCGRARWCDHSVVAKHCH